jgi:hypothetical protein
MTMTTHRNKFLTLSFVLFCLSPSSDAWTGSSSSSSIERASHSSRSFWKRRPTTTLHAIPSFDESFGRKTQQQQQPQQRNPAIVERGPMVRRESAPPSIREASEYSAIQRSNPDRRTQALTRVDPRQDAEYTVKPTIIQGSSLRTWSFTTSQIQSVQVSLFTEGRPLNANVDVWTGPDSTPQKMAVYLEDGSIRPFNAVVFVPGSVNGQKHAVAVRNTGAMEFPIKAAVEVGSILSAPSFSMDEVAAQLFQTQQGKTIQGGSVKTFPFSPMVTSIQLLLTSDGRPLNARIEMLQGPDNVKQIMEVYSEDGSSRPFFAIIETPGYGNVVRIVNTGPMEFPIECRLEPHTVEDGGYDFFDGDFGGEYGPRNGRYR